MKTIAFSIIIAIFACLAVMFFTKSLLVFVATFEGYNLCYILFLHVLNTDRQSIKRLLLQSMFVFAIVAFGLCLLSINANDEVGKLLIFIGVLFKLGAVPFHSWIIDIYEHSSLGTIAVTDGIFKVILTTVFIKLISVVNIGFMPLLYILGYASLAIGAVSALRERNIKRWLGCLSIGHVGIVLCTISTVPNNLSVAGLIYIFTYGFCVVALSLIKNNIFRAVAIFAMLGLPPFHVFFAKVKLIEELLKQSCICELSAIVIYFVLELISAIRYIKRFAISAKLHN